MTSKENLEVVIIEYKKELLERYECMKDCYANIREKICYKELTNKYKEMLEN